MLDPQRLLAFRIPEVREEWTKRDSSLYALSVGMGNDPADRRRLRFLRPGPGQTALPSMATVMAHPGFWLEDPAAGVDAGSALHVAQSIELHEPLPVARALHSRTRITGLVDRGPGRDAFLHATTELHEAGSGRLLATTTRVTILRGQGGFGEKWSIAPPATPRSSPEGNPDWVLDVETRPEQALLYALHGDQHPLHTDPDVAAAAGFPAPLLHGLCTMGLVTHALIVTLCDFAAERMKAIGMRFAAPVYPGDTLTVSIWSDGSFKAEVRERQALVVRDGYCTVA